MKSTDNTTKIALIIENTFVHTNQKYDILQINRNNLDFQILHLCTCR